VGPTWAQPTVALPGLAMPGLARAPNTYYDAYYYAYDNATIFNCNAKVFSLIFNNFLNQKQRACNVIKNGLSNYRYSMSLLRSKCQSLELLGLLSGVRRHHSLHITDILQSGAMIIFS